MIKKKPVTELTSEELLKVIENTQHIEVEDFVDYTNDIMDFISFFNLKQGKEKVTTKLLYKIYSSWSKYKVSRPVFTKHLGMFFKTDMGRAEYGILVFLNLNHNKLLRKSLKRINKKVKTRRKFYKEHFENYLIKYSIQKGSFFIKDTILYNIYDKWIYSFKKRSPLSLNQFQKFFKLFNFDTKRIDRSYWFGVDKSIIQHLSKDSINEMRKFTNAKKTNETKQE